jgi:hypothetical protein
VAVGLVAAALHHLAFFIQRGFLVDIVGGAVQVVHVSRHAHALGVVPRAGADAITRVNVWRAVLGLRAQIRAPVTALAAGGGGELLAVLISA